MPPRPVSFDPELPLRNERHEAFARLRALLVPTHTAAREAGYDDMTPGNAAKLDRRADIRARIAALTKLDEEIIRGKRERLESRLWKVIEADIVRDFAVIENGEIVKIDWEAVVASGMSSIIRSFKFHAKTGKLASFERDDVLQAVSQIRDMHGFEAPRKIAQTNSKGDDITLEQLVMQSFELQKMADEAEPPDAKGSTSEADAALAAERGHRCDDGAEVG